MHKLAMLFYLFTLVSLQALSPRQAILIGKIPILQAQKSSDETELHVSHAFGQENLELVYLNKAGHAHLGLDLNLAELLGSRAVGDLLEEYLLAYLLDCKLDSYPLKASIPRLSKQDFAAKISSLKTDMQLSTKTTDSNSLKIELNNPQVKLGFEIPLSLLALYGQDKKDLELDLQRQIVTTAQFSQQEIPDFPDIELLTPYRDSLYVWEKPPLDSLFTAPLFFAMQDTKLQYVFSAQDPLESLYNYLLLPQAFEPELPIALKHNLYGNSSKQAQITYSALHSLLCQGMLTALNIRKIERQQYAVMLLFYDSVTGARHLLHGTIDADQLFAAQPQGIALTLYSYIIGDAKELQSSSGREPLWQINVK